MRIVDRDAKLSDRSSRPRQHPAPAARHVARIDMSCKHPRSNDELPCPWPDCPQGTPQQTIVLMRGDEGVLRARPQARLEVVAEEGVELYRRARHGDGWDWEKQPA